jgi:purine-binding chemotaxis protein CheW
MNTGNKSDYRQFVSFTVGSSLYGFDILLVKEITPALGITPVPLMTSDVRGIVNIRGQVVLVLDISAILDENPRQPQKENQIIVLKTSREMAMLSDFTLDFDPEDLGKKPTGFLVDSIGEIITVQSGRLEGTPSHLGKYHTPYIKGVVRLDEPLIVLNAGKIIAVSPLSTEKSTTVAVDHE